MSGVFGSSGLDRIYDAVEASLPGVAHPMVQLALRDTLDEFCVRSIYWRQPVGWTMVAGTLLVDLNPIDNVALVAWVLGVSGLRAWVVRPPGILIDAGDGSTDRTGMALVACKPNWASAADFAIALPSFLTDDWSEALRDGVLFRLHGQLAKPYSSPPLAMYHGKRFRAQIQLAREAARNSGDFVAPGFPYFANGRQLGAGTGSFGGAGDSAASSTPAPTVPLVDGALTFDGGNYDPPDDGSTPAGSVVNDGGLF